MGFLGLGLPKGHKYEFKAGDHVRYSGKDADTKAKYADKKLTVRSCDYKDGKNYCMCSVGSSSKATVRFSEAILNKAPKKSGLGVTATPPAPVANAAGLGKLKPLKKIQDVDKRAKEIQHQSGVKKTVEVDHYNISRKKAREMAWKELSVSKKK